jgi:hypothetical protein
MADQDMVGGESVGLKKSLLADFWKQIGTRNHDAGLTEETNKMIQEAVQNCH